MVTQGNNFFNGLKLGVDMASMIINALFVFIYLFLTFKLIKLQFRIFLFICKFLMKIFSNEDISKKAVFSQKEDRLIINRKRATFH